VPNVPHARFSDLEDGNYKAVAAARWNNRGVGSNQVPFVVHSIRYDVQLVPTPLFPKLGEIVSFRAELTPTVKDATYIFHFGDVD